MHISCPKCHFKRSVNSSQIPASASVATCPKCENKFRFRDPETGDLIDEICSDIEGVNTAQAENTSENAHTNGISSNSDSHVEDETSADTKHDAESFEKKTEADAHKMHSDEENLDQDNDQSTLSTKNSHSVESEKNLHADQATARNDDEESNAQNDNKDANSSQNLINTEDPKPLREEDLTKRYDNEDRDNPLRHPQENAHPYAKKKENEKYQMITDDVPWEHPERYGIFGSLVQTIARVMFRAPDFFSTIHSQSSALRPATFYALLGLFQTLCLQIWLSTFDTSLLANSPGLQEGISQFSAPMTIIMSPFLSVFQLLLFSAFLYLAIRITNPEQADYNLILRIVAYAYAPTILVVVPYIGPLVGLIWFVVNIFIGVKYALRLTWQRTILALSPIFLLWLFLIGSSLSQTIM